jgi:hypothetical protein
MSETTSETSTATAPRFPYTRHASTLLRTPLPEALLEKVPAKQRREHEQLRARQEAQQREHGRLRRELAEAPARDRAAAAQAARAGEELPEPSEHRLRAEIEQAQRDRQALEDALADSANGLLAAAVPAAGGVADELEAQLAGHTDDVRARLADLDDSLTVLAELTVAAMWVRSLAGTSEATIHPYQTGRGRAFTATAGELKTVAAAFAEDVASAEERRRLAADERVHRQQLGEQWQRERRASAAERGGA